MRRFVLLALFLVLFIPLSVSAAQLHVDESVNLKDGKIDDNVYVISGDFIQDSIVHGDVTSITRRLNILRPIRGDLLSVSSEATMNSEITGSVRIIANDLIVSSEIENDLAVIASDLRIDSNAEVGGDIIAMAGNIEMLNDHSGDVTLKARYITLDADIDGDVNLKSSDVELRSGARIHGDLNYTAKERIPELEDIVDGEVEYNENADGTAVALFGVLGIGGGLTFLNILWLLIMLGIGLLLIHFSPYFTRDVTENLRTRPYVALLYGIIMLVITPIVATLFLFTVIGIPISALLILLLVMCMVFGKIYTIFFVGEYLCTRIMHCPFHAQKSKKRTKEKQKEINDSIHYMIGLAAYAVLSFIPIISFFVGLFAIVFGLGAAFLSDIRILKYLREKKLL